MIKTYLSKTSIFKAFAAVCIFGISISGCTSKKKTPMETTGTTENELTMLVGTYTSGTSKGIYSYRFNEENGTATPLSETEVENPSYLVPSADGKFVYAVSEFNNTQAAAKQCGRAFIAGSGVDAVHLFYLAEGGSTLTS